MISLLYSANIIIPIFILILIGILSRRKGLIDSHFISTSSKVVFNLALPTSIFNIIYNADITTMFNPKVVIITTLVTILCYFMAFLLSNFFCKEDEQKGAFIQSSIRGNTAIFGIAIIERALSKDASAMGASLLVFLIPLYNLLGVLALTSSKNSGNRADKIKTQVKNIISNPLIIAIFFGVIFSIFKFQLPNLVETSLSYLSKMTLPLALLGIGGTLELRGLKSRIIPTIAASVFKLIFLPLLTVIISLIFNLEGEELAVIFILSGSPVAVSAFTMAKALDNDADLTADVITITTLFSIITIGFGLFMMKNIGII